MIKAQVSSVCLAFQGLYPLSKPEQKGVPTMSRENEQDDFILIPKSDLDLLIRRLDDVDGKLRRIDRMKYIFIFLAILVSFFPIFTSLAAIVRTDVNESNLITTKCLITRQLFIRDDDGTKGQLVLTYNEHGSPVLTFFGPNDKARMTLGLNPEGDPGIALFGPASIALLGSNLARRLELGVAADDLPAIKLNDRNDQNRVAIMMTPDGTAALQVANGDGKRGIQLLATENEGRSVLKIIGKDNDDYNITK
jgi:hypothetical protein